MRRYALLFLFLLLMAWPAWGDPTPSVPSEAPVRAVSETYDFGSRSILDLSPIAHTFVLQAGTKAPVIVDRLQPSCHCTQAVSKRSTDGYGRFTIPAGQTVGVDVTVNPNDMAPGDIEKEVYVFVNGESVPGVTLHIRGIITPAVVFSVPALDFGRVVAGTARALPLTVTLDPRLLAPGQTVRLVCSNPSLKITRQREASASARQQTYQITPALGIHRGAITGTLYLALAPGDTARTASWSIPVRGEVLAPGNAH